MSRIGKLLSYWRSDKEENAELTDALEAEDRIDMPLACMLLCLDMAAIDRTYSLTEHEFIRLRIMSRFALDERAFKEVQDRAHLMLKNFAGPGLLGQILREQFSIEERREMLELASDLALADGEGGAAEALLKDRYEKLLGL